MKREEFEKAFSGIDDRYLTEALDGAPSGKTPGKKTAKTLTWKRTVLIAAAAFTAVALIAAAAFAVGAEEKEYKKALAFFEESGLDAEGLTRSEIKAVYKDITTETFALDATLGVLNRTIAEYGVDGYEFLQNVNDPGKTKELWEKFNSGEYDRMKYFVYESDPEYVGNTVTWENGEDKLGPRTCTVTRSRGGEKLWTAELPMDFSGLLKTKNGVFVYGRELNVVKNDKTVSHEIGPARVFFLDGDGKILWSDRRDRFDLDYERGIAAYEQEGGALCLIAEGQRGSYKDRDLQRLLTVTVYGPQGAQTLYKENDVTDGDLPMYAEKALRFGDGGLLLFGGGKLFFVDNEGTLTPFVSYREGDRDYIVKDLELYHDLLFLSTGSVRYKEDDVYYGRRESEFIAVIQYLNAGDAFDLQRWLDKDKLLEVFRENNEAVLLVCSPDGTPKTFFSKKAAIGGKLETDDEGRLHWFVETPIEIVGSPYTSSHSLRILSQVSEYVFDENGALLSETEAEEPMFRMW
ncbi:MAG: hypothetical protein IJU52_06525 [Clostridia bacterium]|nr:hypothetical protein [Clostridia bacterium]